MNNSEIRFERPADVIDLIDRWEKLASYGSFVLTGKTPHESVEEMSAIEERLHLVIQTQRELFLRACWVQNHFCNVTSPCYGLLKELGVESDREVLYESGRIRSVGSVRIGCEGFMHLDHWSELRGKKS